MSNFITCSHCTRRACYSGGWDQNWGDDGDFYCESHKGRAVLPPVPMED